jgi:hypothetical protein
VSAADEIERCAGAAVEATGLTPGNVATWQDALRAAGRRLEAAWLGLEDAVEREAARWQLVADEVARWKRPLWPVMAVGAAVTAAAAWLGLVLGGYVPAPAWLTAVWTGVTGR